jgi:hypothetical protein
VFFALVPDCRFFFEIAHPSCEIAALVALLFLVVHVEALTSSNGHTFLSSLTTFTMKLSYAALSLLLCVSDAFVTPPAAFARTSSLAMAVNPDKSEFLTPSLAKACIDAAGGSPVYAYSLNKLDETANACLAFPNPYGLTVRYAAKASPNAAILKFFSSKGIHIDASSGYEVRRAMSAGIPPENISLSSQELPVDFYELMDMGVKVNAW